MLNVRRLHKICLDLKIFQNPTDQTNPDQKHVYLCTNAKKQRNNNIYTRKRQNIIKKRERENIRTSLPSHINSPRKATEEERERGKRREEREPKKALIFLFSNSISLSSSSSSPPPRLDPGFFARG